MVNTDEEAMLDKIRKLLESAGQFERNVCYLIDPFSLLLGVYSKLQMVIGRVFQRVPNLLQEFDDQLSNKRSVQTDLLTPTAS